MIQNRAIRILAIAPLTRGFGYAVMEGPENLLAAGNKGFRSNKNAKTLAWVEKFINRYQPTVLVLPKVYGKDTHRAKRIQLLHHELVLLAGKHLLKVRQFSATQQRDQLLADPKGTKYEMAEKLAAQFPAELADRLPPKRKPWMSEDPRMDTFDAVGLAAVFWKPLK